MRLNLLYYKIELEEEAVVEANFMNKKTTAALIGGFLVLLVAVFVILKISNPKIMSIEDGKSYAEQDFLKNQRAAVYISKDAEQLEKAETKGSVVFIDTAGKLKSYAINAVEYGNIVAHKNSMMIEQSDEMAVVSNQVHKTKFETAEYRGMRAGYLPKTKQFYAVYNSGLSDKYDYKMTVRYGSEYGDFKSAMISNFVSAIGEDQDRLLLVTQDLISNEFQLKTMRLNGEKKSKTALVTDLHLPQSSSIDIISQVVADEEAYYFVVSNYKSEKNEQIILYRVDRETLQVTSKTLAYYKTVKQTENSLPVTYNDSLHLWNGKLYFINGYGEVYDYTIKTKKVGNDFKLDDFPAGNYTHTQIRFTNESLYALYLDDNKQMYLDHYNLETKARVQHEKVNALKKYTKDEAIITNLTIFSK